MNKPNENIDNQEYSFSKDEIESVVQTRRDFLDGKTTAREWTEIESDLDERYTINHSIDQINQLIDKPTYISSLK